MKQRWFRPRSVGIGWTPASWQGWLATAVLVGVEVVVWTMLPGHGVRAAVAVGALALFGVLAYLTSR